MVETPRRSLDIKAEDGKDEQDKSQELDKADGVRDSSEVHAESQSLQAPTQPLPSSRVEEEVPAARPSIDSYSSISARPSQELTRTSSKALESTRPDEIETNADSKASEHYEQLITQMQYDHEAAELRRQEETHDYLERIDALQSKLQYLTKEATELAKSTLSDAKPGSTEQKLAKQDEKIALLMEEGWKLSQTELKHMSIIKKLRAKSTEDDIRLAATKRSIEKHEKATREAQERTKRAEVAERRAFEQTKTLPKLEKELEAIKQDREAQATLIRDLQRQLSDATSAARQAEAKAQADALEFEQRLTADLREELAGLNAERDASDQQHRAEMRDLRDRAERERERARIADIERQGEQNVSCPLFLLLSNYLLSSPFPTTHPFLPPCFPTSLTHVLRAENQTDPRKQTRSVPGPRGGSLG